MPSSMTGFGRAEQSVGDVAVTVEVRSVNNRYLNVKTRVPPRFLRFESGFEEEVRRVVARGTVEVSVRLRNRSRRDRPVVDARLAQEYLSAVAELASATRLAGELNLETLVGLPGVVSLEENDQVEEEELGAVLTALRRALKELGAARREEGERLKTELLALLGQAEKAAGAIGEKAPQVPARYQKKLHQRVRRLLDGSGVELDVGQLEREVALIADRADVTEELARLVSHFRGFRSTLNKAGAIGRSLDFLVQELGREANTIGSKNQDVAIGRRVIELKTWIERLREQLQNLE